MKSLPKNLAIVLAVIIMALLHVAAAEQSDPQLPAANGKLLDPNGNFTLYVSNQSFAIDPVDVRVEIDGELVVSEYFKVGSQHSFKTFRLFLSKGTHRIHIWSEKGEANLTKEFELKDYDKGVVTYFYYPDTHYSPTPRQLHFEIHKGPLMIA
jgi:hypothetical protein